MFLKNILVFFIIIYFINIPLILAYHDKKYTHKINELTTFFDHNLYENDSYKTIDIESDTAEINYPNEIKLLGNVLIKQNNNIIKSNKLTIYHNFYSNNIINTILFAEGNVSYHAKNIILTGSYAKFNLNNKNVDFHQSTFNISNPHIYGSAHSIIQRKDNRYTIIKKGNFTSCISNHNYWNIIGSHILYDHFNNTIHIWNAHLDIKKIPLFYSPYLLLDMYHPNILGTYIPHIKYSNKHGLMLKVPFPLFFSKYYSATISPYYINHSTVGIDTKMYYKILAGKGLLTINFMENTTKNNALKSKIYWKHHGNINKKWHFKTDYLFKNDFQNYLNHFNNPCSIIVDNRIDQKILCYYNNKHCKISAAYLNISNNYKHNIFQKHCTYAVAPQLEMHIFFNNYIKKKLFNFQIFNQFSKFIPLNTTYPDTIRLHTEPILNLETNNSWLRSNTEAKLKITHYQQNNINIYNINQTNNKFYLQNKINRVVPQFKINGKMILTKKTNKTKNYKYFLEPTLQYLYIPYIFQENIGIYDTKTIHLNHNNFFHGTKYTGLDRIESKNQITGNIMLRCLNKNYNKFYMSIGQTLNVNQDNHYFNNNKIYKHKHHASIIPKITACSSGIGQWNINNHWNIFTEIQYDTEIKTYSFGNTVLEYSNNNNTVFQSNYRYINSKYLHKNLINYDNNKYYQTISQLGITTHYPLTDHWIINCSSRYNIKSNFLINQTVGIRYLTPCCTFSIILKCNIVNWSNKSNANSYENQIKLHFNLFNTKQSHSKSKTSTLLDCSTISDQHIMPY